MGAPQPQNQWDENGAYPAEAVRRIPPASRHAVETAPVRRAAAWLTDFSTLYEQEVQNGTYATE